MLIPFFRERKGLHAGLLLVKVLLQCSIATFTQVKYLYISPLTSRSKSVHYSNWVTPHDLPFSAPPHVHVSLTLHTRSRNNPLTSFTALLLILDILCRYCIKFTGIIH